MIHKNDVLVIKKQREELIFKLESIYHVAFDRLVEVNLGEKSLGKLTQLILNSKEAAIKILENEIEKQI